MTNPYVIFEKLPRWSTRRLIAFVVVTNGIFWAVVIWACFKLFG